MEWRCLKIFKSFSESKKKSSRSFPNTFNKNRWKGSKRSNRNTAKLCKFYEDLLPKKVFNCNETIAHYLKDITLPKLTKKQRKQWKGEITKNEVEETLGKMVCNKTHGNDGLTNKFYKAFGSELKTPLLLSYKKSFFVMRMKHFSRKRTSFVKKSNISNKNFKMFWLIFKNSWSEIKEMKNCYNSCSERGKSCTL